MKQTDPLTPIKRFFRLLQVDKQEILSIYVYALFNGIITLSLPLGIQAIINFISGGQVSTSWIVLVIFVILGVALTGVMQILQLSISENIQQKIFTRSAFEFAYRIPRLKMEAVEQAYVPELVNRFFDTLSVQKGLSKILMDFSSASLQVLFGLILLSLYHPFFILYSLILVGVVYLIFRFTAPKGLTTSLKESSRKYEVVYWLEELARTMETFKLAGKSPLPMDRTDQLVSNYLDSRKAHFKTLLVQYINLVGFKVIIVAGLLLIGGLLVINQQMNIGQFVASEIIIILVLASVEKLILSMETIYDVLASIEKIGNVTDLPLESDSGEQITDDSEAGLAVHIENLTYTYSASNFSLKDVCIDIQPGEKICLAGPSGAGKSILLQICAALMSGYQGTLSYNRLPIKNWNKEALRSLIGDSLSNEDIFRGSVQENIGLCKPGVDITDIQDAAVITGLHSFIETLEDGYQTLLSSEGKNIPKNIRQKIMLSRCLLGNPKLVLLENNFNTLNKTDKQRFLDHLLNKKTTLIAVSNDPQIAEQFDRVILLDRGSIIATGGSKEIVSSPLFKEVTQMD